MLLVGAMRIVALWVLLMSLSARAQVAGADPTPAPRVCFVVNGTTTSTNEPITLGNGTPFTVVNCTDPPNATATEEPSFGDGSLVLSSKEIVAWVVAGIVLCVAVSYCSRHKLPTPSRVKLWLAERDAKKTSDKKQKSWEDRQSQRKKNKSSGLFGKYEPKKVAVKLPKNMMLDASGALVPIAAASSASPGGASDAKWNAPPCRMREVSGGPPPAEGDATAPAAAVAVAASGGSASQGCCWWPFGRRRPKEAEEPILAKGNHSAFVGAADEELLEVRVGYDEAEKEKAMWENAEFKAAPAARPVLPSDHNQLLTSTGVKAAPDATAAAPSAVSTAPLPPRRQLTAAHLDFDL